MEKGWIKLHRKLLHSDMYKSLNSKQRDVMFVCLMLANHSENSWEFAGKIYKCEAGQFITSLPKLAELCANDVKVQSIRTALLKLERWGFLTNKSTAQNRLVTICNWDTYQQTKEDVNSQTNRRLTDNQQTTNRRLTANKNDKELKNDKNDKNLDNVIGARKQKFAQTLTPFIEKYGKETIMEFYEYWTEPNKSKTKFRQELEKTWDTERRLGTWVKNDFTKKEKHTGTTEKKSKVETVVSQIENALKKYS